MWAYDFVFDACANGQVLKCLTVIDEYTRECLAIDVAGSIRSGRVIEVQMDEKITDPTHELAVQGHDDERVNGAAQHALEPLLQPSPNDLADSADADAADASEADEE